MVNNKSLYIFTVVGYFGCFIIQSLCTEHLLNKTYNGQKFRYSTLAGLMQSLFMIFAVVGMKVYKKEKISFQIFQNKDLTLAGFSQSLAIFCSVMLSFKLDYLMKILIRSSKFISLLIGALIFKSGKYDQISRTDLSLAFILTLGVVIFHLGTPSHKSTATEFVGFLYGLASLFFDSLVSHFQQNIKKNENLSFTDLTLGMNVFMFIFSLLQSIFMNELIPMFSFFYENPICLWDQFLNILLMTVGLLFLFQHLHHFGPISVAYIATFRKIVTVLLSIVVFNHEMNLSHMAGLGLIFAVIMADFLQSLQKKPVQVKAKTKTE